MMQQNHSDLLNALSLLIGLQNLQENREQSEHNDVEIANNKQAQFLLGELTKQFADVKQTLNKILSVVTEIRDAEYF